MNRLSLVAACLSGVLAFGCGPKEFGSVCTEVPAPAECMTACDPSPGAAASCTAGFHCSPDGKCDAQCTPGGGQCGDGYMCTPDGYCVDDGGGGGSSAPDASCPAVNFTPMPTTPSIGLVLDQSGSMSEMDVAPTRYRAMVAALTGPGGVVTQLQAKAYFGHNQYTCNSGNQDNSTLSLKTTPRALNNAAAIGAQLATATFGLTGNSFNTPTHAATNAMVADFAANPPPLGSPPIIVLATDGEPNSCGAGPGANGGRPQSVAAAAAAHAAGIPVYVLAIGINNSHFQDLANAGQGSTTNVPYYPVTNAAQLQAAFQTIINGVISCDLSLTSSIDATQAMNGTLTINGVQQTYGTDWMLVGGNVIRVTGAACNMLKNTPNPTVQATFPCGSVIF